MLTPLSNADLCHSVQVHTSLGVKKESTKSASNKWTKTFNQGYLPCIGNFCVTVLNVLKKDFFWQH